MPTNNTNYGATETETEPTSPPPRRLRSLVMTALVSFALGAATVFVATTQQPDARTALFGEHNANLELAARPRWLPQNAGCDWHLQHCRQCHSSTWQCNEPDLAWVSPLQVIQLSGLSGSNITLDGTKVAGIPLSQGFKIRKCCTYWSDRDCSYHTFWDGLWSCKDRLKSGDMVALVGATDSRALECAGWPCFREVFPPPAGHWGIPLMIKLAGSEHPPGGHYIVLGDEVEFFPLTPTGWDYSKRFTCDGVTCGRKNLRYESAGQRFKISLHETSDPRHDLSLALDKSTYSEGQPIEVMWSGDAEVFLATDWLGIYPAGSCGETECPAGDYAIYAYAPTPEGTLVIDGTLAGFPLAAGAWEVAYLSNDGYAVRGVPRGFTVRETC